MSDFGQSCIHAIILAVIRSDQTKMRVEFGKFLIFTAITFSLPGALAADATATDALRNLGERLFSETALSADGKVSCAHCHQVQFGFTDQKRLSEGIGAQLGTRNTPSLIGAASEKPLFWDGRQSRLDLLVMEPLLNPREHGLRDVTELETRLDRLRYVRKFERELPDLGTKSTAELAVRALATFVSSLTPESSTLERLQALLSDDGPATTARRGAELFRGRAGCSSCHHLDAQSAPLTDSQFHDHGIAQPLLMGDLAGILSRWQERGHEASLQDALGSPEFAALGRYLVTGSPDDIGKFKTPSLFNVAVTGPYMHDGSIASLDEAIAHEIYYSAPDRGAGLDFEDRHALAAFLRSLTDARYEHLLKQ